MEEQKRAFKGIWIPAEIWLSKELTLIEKVMLVEIDSLDNDDGCYANNRYFAEFFNLSKSRISQIIKSLETKGLIEIKYEYTDKNFSRRTIKTNQTLFNLLNTPIKYSKAPYLENAKHNNTFNNNTSNKRESERKQDELKNKNLINHFQQKITQLNPRDMEELLYWKDDFNSKGQGYEIVEYAIEVSEQANAYSFGYLKKKLKGYSDAKVTTLEQAQGYENKGNKKTSKRQTGNLIKQRMEEAKTSEYDRDTGA